MFKTWDTALTPKFIERNICNSFIERYKQKLDTMGIPVEFRKEPCLSNAVVIPFVKKGHLSVSVLDIVDDICSPIETYKITVPVYCLKKILPAETIKLGTSIDELVIRHLIDVPVVLGSDIDVARFIISASAYYDEVTLDTELEMRIAVVFPLKYVEQLQSNGCGGCSKRLKCILKPELTLGCLLK
jgi:hypothetical protein